MTEWITGELIAKIVFGTFILLLLIVAAGRVSKKIGNYAGGGFSRSHTQTASSSNSPPAPQPHRSQVPSNGTWRKVARRALKLLLWGVGIGLFLWALLSWEPVQDAGNVIEDLWETATTFPERDRTVPRRRAVNFPTPVVTYTIPVPPCDSVEIPSVTENTWSGKAAIPEGLKICRFAELGDDSFRSQCHKRYTDFDDPATWINGVGNACDAERYQSLKEAQTMRYCYVPDNSSCD